MENEIVKIFETMDLRTTRTEEVSGLNVNGICIYVHPNDLRNCNFSNKDIFKVVKKKYSNVVGMFSDSNYFSFILRKNDE